MNTAKAADRILSSDCENREAPAATVCMVCSRTLEQLTTACERPTCPLRPRAVDLSPELQDQLEHLRQMPDSEIDTSDIPETTDWSDAKRGAFAHAPADEHETAECTTCGERGCWKDSTWQQWQCGCCGSWNERGILPAA